MSLALVGATGFIGRHLRSGLQDLGWTVRAIERSDADLRDPRAPWPRLFEGCSVIINAAGMAHDRRQASSGRVDEYYTVNAVGAQRVAKAAAQVGAQRFVQVSSIKVLGDQPRDGDRFRESDSLRPRGLYAQSKALAEDLVTAELHGSATGCVIVRLPLVIGQPYQGNLGLLEKAVRRGVPLPLEHQDIGRRTYLMADDLVELVARALRVEAGSPLVLHGRSQDLAAGEVVRLIARSVGCEPRLVAVHPRLLKAGGASLGRSAIASKLCDEMLVADDASRALLRTGS